MTVAKKLNEFLQLASLLPKIARGTDELSETLGGNFLDRVRMKKLLAAESTDRALDVRPGCVLRKDRADDYLKARAPRPPVLRTVGAKQRIIIIKQLWKNRGSGDKCLMLRAR